MAGDSMTFVVEFGVRYPWHNPGGDWFIQFKGPTEKSQRVAVEEATAADVLALADAVAPAVAEALRDSLREQAANARELAEQAERGIRDAEVKAAEADRFALRVDRTARTLAPEGMKDERPKA